MQCKTYHYTFLHKMMSTELIKLLQQSSKIIPNFQHHCRIHYLMSFLNKSHRKIEGHWIHLISLTQPHKHTMHGNSQLKWLQWVSVWWKIQNKHLNKREKVTECWDLFELKASLQMKHFLNTSWRCLYLSVTIYTSNSFHTGNIIHLLLFLLAFCFSYPAVKGLDLPWWVHCWTMLQNKSLQQDDKQWNFVNKVCQGSHLTMPILKLIFFGRIPLIILWCNCLL